MLLKDTGKRLLFDSLLVATSPPYLQCVQELYVPHHFLSRRPEVVNESPVQIFWVWLPVWLDSFHDADGFDNKLDDVGRVLHCLDHRDVRRVKSVEGAYGRLEGGDGLSQVVLAVIPLENKSWL
jgi:hypothetical protein